MSHPFVLGELAIERRDAYLKEAENHRTARQVNKKRSVVRSLLNRLVVRFWGLRIGLMRRTADQGRIATGDAFTENKSKITAG